MMLGIGRGMYRDFVRGVCFNYIMTVSYEWVAPAARDVRLTPEQESVVTSEADVLTVLGSPRSGKTTTLVRAGIHWVATGRGPHVLFLASSRSQAARVRALMASLSPWSASQITVVTTYGLAQSVVNAVGDRPVTLLTAARQDAHVRELLRSDALMWPDALGQARLTDRFAAQVREQVAILSRLGLTPQEVIQRGQDSGREDWGGLGAFFEQYLATLALSGECDYVGLVSRACDLAQISGNVERFRPSGSLILVDDAEDLDETHLRLVEMLVDSSTPIRLATDVDAQIDEFRGARWRGLFEVVEEWGKEGKDVSQIVLPSRLPGAIARACQTLRGRIPVPPGLRLVARDYRGLPDNGRGRVHVMVARDDEDEVRAIADTLRIFFSRGGAWEDMAVLVRKKSQVATFAQSLEFLGIPIALSGEEIRANQSGAVRTLLAGAEWVITGEVPRGAVLRSLAQSPLGKMDIALVSAVERRFAHVVSESDPLLAGCVAGSDETAVLVGRIAKAREGLDIHEILWSLWISSGWDKSLREQAEGVGVSARLANRDLDAVGELFRQASGFTGADPEIGFHGLQGLVNSAEIPEDLPRASVLASRGVRVTTAHRAKGESWPLVVVAGVQAGVWPARGLPAPILSLSGLDERIGESGRVESTEMRLAWVACTCATEQLMITAVASGEERPSAWVDTIEAERVHSRGEVVEGQPSGKVRVPLDAVGLIAQLRRQASSGTSALQVAARARLVDLASTYAHADPSSWWGVSPSVEDNAVDLNERKDSVRLSFSPSTVEALLACPRKWWLETKGGGARPSTFATSAGSLFHRLIAENPDASAAILISRLGEEWPSIAVNAEWMTSALREKYEAALERFVRWRDHQSQEGWHHVGSEADFGGQIRIANRSHVVDYTVTLHGRIDWLAQNESGNVRVADFKTGKAVPSQKQAQSNVQLGIYQLALAQGLIESFGGPRQPSGAELVYVSPADVPASGMPVVRQQSALDYLSEGVPSSLGGDGGVPSTEISDGDDDWSAALSGEWRDKIGGPTDYDTTVHHQLAVACAIVEEATFPAVSSTACRLCAVQAGCPLPQGRRTSW